MRTQVGRHLFLPALGLAVLGGALSAQPLARLGAVDRRALARAEGLFAEEEERGDLPIEAVYVLTGGAEAGQAASLDVVADLAGAGLGAAGGAVDRRFRVSLVAESRDGETYLRHHEALATGAGVASAWLFEATVELPAEVRDLAVVVEELASGLWGATVAEEADERLVPPPRAALSVRAGLWSVLRESEEEAVAEVPEPVPPPSAPSPGPAPPPPRQSPPAGQAPPPASGRPGEPGRGAPAGEEPAEAGRSSVIRLLPPQGRRLAGPTSFDTLISAAEVAKVSFRLDGKEVAVAAKDPFDARIALAGPGHPQSVEAVAFAADGTRMGADAITVNDPVRSFRARLARVEGRPETGLEIEVEVSVPGRTQLERVEVYWNEERVARFAAPPFLARIAPRASSGQDFVRAVAVAADGTQVEDVRLLTSEGVVEEIEVTLVELFVVATDRDGRPVKDLAAGDFAVAAGGRPQELERVAFASEVPLLLGVVIDTSGSMELIMEDTRRAAGQFLASTLTDLDRAFLVDFADRPRLRHRPTGDLMELLASFKGLRAEGNTALYDAVVFSMLEFADGFERRALVVLTDGADTKSGLGPNRVIRYGRRIGVPVYVIALGGRQALRGSSLLEVEAITKETGGRLYLADDLEALAGAYAEINAELRSQYLLTFYVEGGDDFDRGGVEVEVRRRGHQARVVVSPR